MKIARLRPFASLSAGLLLLAGCGAGSSPDATVKSFYNLLAEGKTEEAKALIDPAYKTAPDAEMVGPMLGKVSGMIKEAGGIKSIEVLSSTINGDTAAVKVKVTLNNGKSQDDDMALVKKDGSWKIDMKTALH